MGVRSVVGRNVLSSLGLRCLVLCTVCVFWLPLFGTLFYRRLVLCSTAVWYSVLPLFGTLFYRCLLLCSTAVWYSVCFASSGYRCLVLCSSVLGDSGGVVNSLDFCPASLKSLGSFYFRCVLSSQWKAVTVNLRILNCQL